MFKGLKKALALFVCMMMVFSVAVSADSLTIGDVSYETTENNTLKVTVPYTVPTGFVDGSQVSLLAYLASSNGTIADAIALNQYTYDSDSSEAVFYLPADKEGSNIAIKMGGTKLSSAAVKTVVLEAGQVGEITYTVKFFDKDGVEIEGSSITVAENGYITEFPTAPTVSGFNFVAWYVDQNASFPVDEETVIIASYANEGVISLYASYEEIEEYDITFKGYEEDQVVTTVAGKVTAPEAPAAAEGQVFKGWTKTEDPELDAEVLDLTTEVFTEATTLYPVFKEAPAYTLGDANGDGEVDVFDALAVLEHDAGISEIEDANLLAADANVDGEVDVFDALLLLEVDAGLAEL